MNTWNILRVMNLTSDKRDISFNFHNFRYEMQKYVKAICAWQIYK